MPTEKEPGLVVPVDDGALNVLEDALNTYIVGHDDNGDPVTSGPYGIYELLEFWSGFDPDKVVLQDDGSYLYTGGPLLTQKDVMIALIAEIRRLRNG